MDHVTAVEITLLRTERRSYGEIAERLGLSVNTVKSYCLRHDLGDNRIQGPPPRKIRPHKEPVPLIGYCLECGTVFKQYKNGCKKYCSDICRQRWMRKNGNGKNKQTCPVCGKEFPVYDDSKPRIYCGLDCYRTARYYTDNPNRTTISFCEVCGKKMEFPGHKTQRFCSQDCYHVFQRNADYNV